MSKLCYYVYYLVNALYFVFKFRCQHGVLNVCYTAGELEKFNGSVVCRGELAKSAFYLIKRSC